MRSIYCLLLALSFSLGSGFAPTPTGKTSKTSMRLFKDEKKTAASLIAATLIAGNVAAAAPAFAAINDFGSSQVVAARSGGRMGGRSMGGGYARSRSYAAPRTTYRSSTTIVRPMIAPPPVVVSPFGGYGYGYNPMGGFGLGYGLGAMNNAGNAVRDYQQESEIQRSKAELEQAKQREAELETRIKALEEQGKEDK